MARKPMARKTLSAAGLLKTLRGCFERIEDPVARRGGPTLADCLMSALAMFGMKYPSLLQFDRDARSDDTVRANLHNLYGVKQAPSDTWMRECLDEVNPRDLRDGYRQMLAQAQRGKGLEGFTCLNGHYLLSVDGTGYYASKKVHCDSCCEKTHRDGTTTYSHAMLGAVLVHPVEREVFPLAPEAIVKSDGSKKNDCERNAAKRLLGGRAPGASASEVGGSRGRAGVERTPHQAVEGVGPALHPGGEAWRPCLLVRVGGLDTWRAGRGVGRR